MSGLVEEIEKHLTEAKQRFDALEHAMVELADLVEQLIQRSEAASESRPVRPAEAAGRTWP